MLIRHERCNHLLQQLSATPVSATTVTCYNSYGSENLRQVLIREMFHKTLDQGAFSYLSSMAET
jgi:hypothetical protein